MDIAIVTGANTRIGLAISQKLIDTGCRVYGLGSDFENFPLEHTDFVPVSCDLTNTEHLCQVVQEILDKEKDIYVLVNHARHLSLDSHEKLGLNDLESLVHTNLLAPLILTRLVLPSLIRLRGYVLNIGFPDLPGSHRLGSAFLSTEVALQEFSKRLYEEVRQDKVKVCSLILDSANAEQMFREGFTERDNHDLIVCSNAIAQAVDYIVSQKRESVVSTLVVRPQKREPDEKDLASARKLAAPKPYASNSTPKKVVIGRLKKKEEPVSEDKGPATYMDMAREIAAEEAKNPSQPREDSADDKLSATEDPPVEKRRRRRRRGRGRGPRDNRRPEVPAKKSQDEIKPKPQKRNNERGAPKGNSTHPKPESSKKDSNNSKRKPEEKKRPEEKQPQVKKTPAKKVSKKKVTAKKQAKKAAPVKKVAAKKQATKKVAAKKTVAKKTAKKAAKKVARKRAQPKS